MFPSGKKRLNEMLFIDHIQELRKRIIVSLLALLCTAIASFILFKPFKALAHLIAEEEVLFMHTIFEGFLIRMKVSIISGSILSFPVHLYNIIRFVFPGLKEKEKEVILNSLYASFILSIFAFYYSYYKVIPISINFLTGTRFIPTNVGLLLNYGKNILYIFQFLLISLLLFQLPIVLVVLMVMNILKRRTLLRASRYVIVVIFILSAILTPPDFISQVSLALPLAALFFLTIVIQIFK